IQPDDFVIGAAQLERENRLQILALQPDFASGPRREQRRGIERRLYGDIVNPGGENFLDIVLQHSSVLRAERVFRQEKSRLAALVKKAPRGSIGRISRSICE